MHHPTDRIAHTTAFVIQVVEHWLERVGLYGGHDLICDPFFLPRLFYNIFFLKLPVPMIRQCPPPKSRPYVPVV